jgi:hypothetical protein
MSRESAKAEMAVDLEIHARLDELAEQMRQIAGVLHDTTDSFIAGQLSITELNGVRLTAEAIIHAAELEADLLRRRPR